MRFRLKALANSKREMSKMANPSPLSRASEIFAAASLEIRAYFKGQPDDDMGIEKDQ
jgi:hypothetical protein